MPKLAALATGALTCAGITYTAIAIARVRRFHEAASRFSQRSSTPASILKPLCGEEPQLFENLCSFCEQEYPAYQVIFGAADPADPALAIARRVAQRYPGRDIDVVAGGAHACANPKIGNLLGMVERARHPLVVIADSDIRAHPSYLHAVTACFGDPKTGAATCAYGGVPADGLASQLGAMQVNDHFTPSVMVAQLVEPLTYCFGATMAVRKDVLERIGGLDAVGGHLADDYVLGKLVTDAGYRVVLAPCAVQTIVADDSLLALLQHELRWARTVRTQRPNGYAGSGVTYVLPLAVAFVFAARTPLSLAAFAAAACLRVWLHYESRRAFAPQTRATPWLIPLRDVLSACVWAAAFFGRRVRWKTLSYDLDAGGRMPMGREEM